MWAVSPTAPQGPRPVILLIHKPATTVHHSRSLLTVSAASSHRPNPAPKQEPQERQKQPEGGAGKKPLSGLDVLWAMQKAAAEKGRASGGDGKKNKKRKGSAGGRGSQKEDEGSVDYSNIRPLCIKSEWGDRLDELEKRLRELSEINK